MKKLLLLLFALGLFSTSYGQLGIRAGLNSGNFSDTNYNAKVGFHAGGYYRMDIGFISVEPGVQFSIKGYETNALPTGAVVSEKLSYLDVPLLVRLNIYEFLNVFVGPQGSLLLARKYELDGNVDSSTDVIKGFDLGGVVGIGVNTPVGVNFQLSYDLGLTSLNYYNSNVQNRVLKLSIGIDI